MSRRVGFTGTRRGMTPAQRATVGAMLHLLGPDLEVHHGAARGADEDFVRLVRERHGERPHVVAHPASGVRPGDVSQPALAASDRVMPARPPLRRNRSGIVAAYGELIATPAEATERLRSGTWATVRYARAAGLPVYLVNPEGGLAPEPEERGDG